MPNISQTTMDLLTQRRDKAAERFAEYRDKANADQLEREDAKNLRDSLDAIIATCVVVP